MKFNKLLSLFAFVTLAVFSLTLASAQSTIFLDDFNSNLPASWSVSGWSLNSSGFIQAANSVAIGTRTASTSGFSNIALSLDRRLVDFAGSFEQTDYLKVLVSYDGSTFNQVGLYNTSSASFVTETISINSQANNNPNFKIGFECNTNEADEFCYVDNVRLSGDSSSNIQVVVTGSEPSQSQPFTLGTNVTLGVSSSTVTGTATMSLVSPISGSNVFSPSLVQLGSTPVPVKVILKQLTGLKFGDQDVTVRATSGSQTGQATFQVRKTFCSAGTVPGNLTIDGISWDNNGDGDKNDWELLDEIEVELDIRNNNNDDEVDAVAILGLFDSNGNDVSDELVFIGDSRQDEEEIEIRIDDDSEETVTWEFKVPADFDAGDYKLAVKVFDEDQGQARDCADTSGDLDESFYQPIKIEQTDDEGKFVIVDEIELDTQLTCGQTTSGQFTVFNVGEDDEERVKITISNRDLGINIVREITSDLDQGEDETLDFSFTVPATAQSGRYVLEFMTEYDYDDGVYDQEADESTDYAIEVIGCSGNIGNPSGGLTNIAIDADLASDARAGEELVIVATITNTGNEDAEFSISARGYSNWAELSDISPSTLSVDAGESEEVTLTMIVNEDASGMQSFDLQVSEDGRVQIQEIEVELASKSSNAIFSSGNSLIWVIGAINFVLIILIIVVAVRMSRR